MTDSDEKQLSKIARDFFGGFFWRMCESFPLVEFTERVPHPFSELMSLGFDLTFVYEEDLLND